MISEVNHNGKTYALDLQNGIDLSIPNKFSGENPIFFNANQPSINIINSENFIGDVKQGGSCNAPIVTLDIHCTGTHTESVGHINDSGVKIIDVCPLGLISASLVTVMSQPIYNTNESYHYKLSTELVITKKSLKERCPDKQEALIIRTLPNDQSKKHRDYDKQPAAFFTNDAIDYISQIGVKHLLVDMPSIDKADDGGQLANHKRFFQQGKTISELLFIPDIIQDGFGFLQIQIPNWGLDAAPSRPIFYPI